MNEQKRRVPPPPAKRRKVVPPPPQKENVPGERALLARWEQAIARYSHTVYVGHAIDMTADDVATELRIALLLEIRRHYGNHGELPSDPLCLTVIRRRVCHLRRATKAKFRVAFQQRMRRDDVRVVEPDDVASVVDLEADLGAVRDQERRVWLVQELKRRLDPKAWALLQLRYVDGVPTCDVAAATRSSTRTSSRAQHEAKAAAREILRSLGCSSAEALQPDTGGARGTVHLGVLAVD